MPQRPLGTGTTFHPTRVKNGCDRSHVWTVVARASTVARFSEKGVHRAGQPDAQPLSHPALPRRSNPAGVCDGYKYIYLKFF